jgi:hypothetical protein
MNWQQNKGFVIGLSALGVLLAGGVTMAILTSSARTSLREELDGKVNERTALESAKIHPSIDNVRKLGEENKALAGFLGTLVDDVRARQPKPAAIASPGDFNLKLESEQKTLAKLAAATKVSLPVLEGEAPQVVPVSLGPKFWFDFNEYGEGGKLADPAHIPLLAIQLESLRDICTSLVKSGISEIKEIHREKVETPVAAVAVDDDNARGKSTAPPVGPVLTNFTCSVAFIAPENAVWSALTALANHALPLVITGVDVQNQSGTLQPAFAGAGAAGGGSLADQLRALSGSGSGETAKKLETAGTELVRVKVSLRVHRVESPEPASETQPPKGS